MCKVVVAKYIFWRKCVFKGVSSYKNIVPVTKNNIFVWYLKIVNSRHPLGISENLSEISVIPSEISVFLQGR